MPARELPPISGAHGSVQARIDALPITDDWGVEAARLLLEAAEETGCSDLHVACLRDEVLARGRRDGALFDLARIAGARRDLLIARFKVLARVPAFVRHEPQDGRMEWQRDPASPPQMLRASFLPTIHGENLVVRFPGRSSGDAPLELEALGMPPPVLAAVERLLARREGTVLLTGPSSSGKTTTMYSMLRRLHDRHGDRLNILTIEDPVEQDLGFAGQVQVMPAQGLSFESALRAALRQDPNVLMIGEIRDAETARIAIQAGMTGHLVLSTLHAGRACLVFTRLLSMGTEPYLVASALSGAIAQRLPRLCCPTCAGSAGVDTADAAETETSPVTAGSASVQHTCTACAGTGYIGRTGIFEVAGVTEPLRELILAKAPPAQIAAEAARSQAGDLVAECRRLADAGRISRLEFEFLFAGEEIET